MEETITRDGCELLARLYDAAIKGDVASLHNLLQLDPLIIDRCSIEKFGNYTQSPLHVAAHFGHLGFVRALLSTNPDLCMARDQEGWNPIHVAAIRGHIEVLDELLKVKPLAAQEVTNRGENVLHLCVKYEQTEALKHLVEVLDDGELLNAKDSIGNTVLHLAVASAHKEMTIFLLKNEMMDKNVMNDNGHTAMDICGKSAKLSSDREVLDCLDRAKALPGKAAKRVYERDHTTSSSQFDALMVVASLIATMAFQVAMSPPGSVWQDATPINNCTIRRGATPMYNSTIYPVPGQSIFGTLDSYDFKLLLLSNVIAFISSTTVILILISGFRYNRFFAVILTLMMWTALSATAITFWVGSTFVIPDDIEFWNDIEFWSHVDLFELELVWALVGWPTLVGCLLLGHLIRLAKNSWVGRLIVRKLAALFRAGAPTLTTNARHASA